MKQNLHTHCQFCDGKDTVEELVRTALDKGFDSLGFSSHGYAHPLDACSLDDEREAAYIYSVLEARARYGDRLKIWLGIEEDLTGRIYADPAFDYVIASVHFIPVPDGQWKAVDYSPELTREMIQTDFQGDFLAYARAYYNELKKIAHRPEADIVGHLDLLMKYNEGEARHPFDDPAYLDLAMEAIDELIAADKIFEINTGAMSRGYRSEPYPQALLLKYIQTHGGKICITSDCHARDNLDCGFDIARNRAKAAGFDQVMVLTEQGFVPDSLWD
ncbi:histidinol-phosphatase HisJ family protein [uncultured Faecalibaculum sp.]|uniref:histidinol-phosphatase HisJ family protein n=1 Tax=uncultured Faecalibaculum sp. TaxID=1729681 RepID=UPI002730E034|nr:histidinol-phosphatase HisJ family protein [uncultured Faecalibaculum sp.]